ncbi:hypothetical protein C8J57DRAFT_1524449 [Mycena rebaudengoi]|nr:hypothetical protein C8J57DRAFT_1524449 [Mycena rebaudengoi]
MFVPCLSQFAHSLSLLPLVFLHSTTTTATRYAATVCLHPLACPALLCAVIAQVSILAYAFRRRAHAPCHLCQNRAGVTKLEIPAARNIQRAHTPRACGCVRRRATMSMCVGEWSVVLSCDVETQQNGHGGNTACELMLPWMLVEADDVWSSPPIVTTSTSS